MKYESEFSGDPDTKPLTHRPGREPARPSHTSPRVVAPVLGVRDSGTPGGLSGDHGDHSRDMLTGAC